MHKTLICGLFCLFALTAHAQETTPVAEAPVAKTIRLNFRAQPWRTVLQWLAEQSKLSIELENAPQGTFNYIDDKFYTPDEALDLVNSFLVLRGFTLVKKDQMLLLFDTVKGSIPPEFVQTVPVDELNKRGAYELTRVLFPLKRTTPEIVEAEIQKMIRPFGTIITFPKSQSILVTEMGGQLRAIREIIEKIDNPEGSGSALTMIELESISGDEAIALMRKLLIIEESDTSLRTAIDATGRRVFVSGRPDMIALAKETLTTIDSYYNPTKRKPEGDVSFRVYTIDTADPAVVLAALQTRLSGTPDVRLQLDTKTNSIVTQGRPSDHQLIQETINEMQVNATRVELISLNKLDPVKAAAAVKKFFEVSSTTTSSGTPSSGTRATTPTGVPAPIVEADSGLRQLYVKANTSQIAQIKSLLESMGEDFGSRRSSDKTIRTIQLSPGAQALVLEQLQKAWPQMSDNELKIVHPSAISASMKDLPIPQKTVVPLPMKKRSNDTMEKPEGEETPVRSTFLPGTQASCLHCGQDARDPRSRQDACAPRMIAPGMIAPRTIAPEIYLVKYEREIDDESDMIPVPKKAAAKKGAPVVLSMGADGIMIASDDPEALDRLEEVIKYLTDEASLGKTQLKVYYLTNTSAEIVGTMLQTLMGSSSYSLSTSSSLPENSPMAAIHEYISEGGIVRATGSISVTADSRLNALYIQANELDHRTIDRLLPILDQLRSPEELLNKAKPRLIQLKNMRAEDAKSSVETIFADRMTGGGNARQGQPQQQGPGGMPPQIAQMLQQMQQGGGGMQGMMSALGGSARGGRTSQQQQEEAQKMTLGIDTRSNSLIVSAPEALFLDVQDFVSALDILAAEKDEVTEIVSAGKTGAQAMLTAIRSLGGSSIVTSSPTTSSSQQQGNRNFGAQGFGGTNTNPFNRGATGGFQGGGMSGFVPQGGMSMQSGGFGGRGTAGGFGGQMQQMPASGRSSFGGATGGRGGR